MDGNAKDLANNVIGELDEVQDLLNARWLAMNFSEIIKDVNRKLDMIRIECQTYLRDVPTAPRRAKAFPRNGNVFLVDENDEPFGSVVWKLEPVPFPESMREQVERVQKKHNITITNWSDEIGRFVI